MPICPETAPELPLQRPPQPKIDQAKNNKMHV